MSNRTITISADPQLVPTRDRTLTNEEDVSVK